LRRDELNAYVEALHRPFPNGWTPFLALGIALKAADDAAPALSWPERDALDATTLRELEELAAKVGLVFASVERQPALALVEAGEWSSGWQDSLLAAAQSLRNAIDLLRGSVNGYLASLGLRPRDKTSPAEIEALAGLAQALRNSRGRDISIMFDPDFSRCSDALAKLDRAISAYRQAEHGLSASFEPSAVRDLDPEALEHQWRQANASMWPGSLFGKRKIRRLLQGYAGRGTAPSRISRCCGA
jgi:hypothetical protein